MESMILAILQARFSSSRLPGKVLKPILGKPMLLHQIERVQHSKMIDKLVVATSVDSSDDNIEKTCINNNIEVFRGSLDNVLDRFYQCSKHYNPSHIVRLTGDCPVVDWQVIDQAIDCHISTKSDYTSNILPPTYPDGLDVEVAKFSALEEASKCAVLPSELEHVMPYLRTNSRFKKFNLESEEDLSEHRWTVDNSEDFEFIEKIYEELYLKNNKFNAHDILKLLEKNPQIKDKNYHIKRNEGALKSYKEDKEFLQKCMKNQNDY
jgi:spore coat polysaccharide biosynthesis protein SpsF